MKTVLCISLLTLVSMQALGGSEKVDSLKQLLEQHTTADKAEVLWGIAYELFDVDNAQALFYAERAYHDVWKRGDSLQIVKVGTTYGQLLRRMGKLDHSIEVSSRMLPIAKRHEYRKNWKMLLNSLGIAYVDKAMFDVALDLNYQSLVLRLEDGDTLEIVTVLQNLGVCHYKLRDHEKSKEYTIQSIQMIEALRKKPSWAASCLRTAYQNLGSVFSSQGHHALAIEHFRRAFLTPNDQNYPGTFGSLVWEFAGSFIEIGMLDSARYYADKAIELGLAERNPYALAQSYIVTSRILTLEEKLSDAEDFLQKAEKIDSTTSYPLLHYAILRQRFFLVALRGRGDETVKTWEKYDRYSDSIEIANGRSRSSALQIAFAQRENESKLKAQSAIMQLQKENLDRQQIFMAIVSALLIMLLTLAFALYKANRQKQEINRMLDRIVEARTQELSRHRDTIQHLIDEENGRRTRAMAELLSMLGSLKGLLHLAEVDPGNPSENYLGKARGLTQQMEVVGQKYSEQTPRKPAIPVG